MKPIDLRLALPALVGWVAAVLLIGVPGSLVVSVAWSAAAGALVVALVLVFGARSGSNGVRAASIPSVVALAVVAAAVALAAPSREPAVLQQSLDDGGVVAVVVELERTVLPSSGGRGELVDALIVAVEQGDGAWVATRVPVLLTGLTADERWPLGTRLDALVRLDALEPGDDRVAFARLVSGGEPRSDAAPLLVAADVLRAGFLELMAPFDGDGAALLPGLAIGDTSAVDESLELAMQRSSLTHLTAVSGANCAIVVGLVIGLGGLLRWPRPVRVGVALVALGGFVVLVTPEPSVVRAAVMAAAVLVALASGRPAQGLPVLGLAVIGIVVLDPWIAREFGFVLSVLATAALLVLAGPLALRLARWMPAPLALGISVPLAAQLACQPVLVLLAPELPLTGVVANVLAAPAAPIATIVGMLACLAAPVLPPLATLLAAIAWLPSAWIAGIARVCSGLPGAMLPWPEGAVGAVLVAVLTIAGLLAAGVPASLGGERLRRRLALGVVAVLVVVAGATAGASMLRSLSRPADWAIAQCDVGQGDAVLVRSAGQVALIDTGADSELLGACLGTLGIDRLDLLVLTHFDHDHVGAVDVVLGRVDLAIVGPTGREADEQVVAALAQSGARVEQIAEGRHGMLGACSWRALWPPDHRGIAPGNDASLVLEWRGHEPGECPSMLALGDLDESAQQRLLTVHRPAPVEVVKVSHHGSPDQHVPLYDELGASIALIGVGADNGYGHPAPALVDSLTAVGSLVARSDLQGLTLVARDDNGALIVWRERVGGAQ